MVDHNVQILVWSEALDLGAVLAQGHEERHGFGAFSAVEMARALEEDSGSEGTGLEV